MAQLTELVKIRNDLQDILKDLSLENNIAEKINIIESVLVKNPSVYRSDIEKYSHEYKKIIDHSNDIIIKIKDFIENINDDIDKQASVVFDTTEYKETFNGKKFNQLLPTNPEIESLIHNSISKYSEWKFPGLQICRYLTKNDWQVSANLQEYAIAKTRIDAMVANDPLYLLGNDEQILQNIIEPFPETYRRRLRLYKFENKDLSVLPQNQFGLIVCWDFLNYLPIADVEHYLKSFMLLLRPGGVLVFSYNNCDIEKSADSAEKFRACWATIRSIKQIISNIGYDFITNHDLPANDILDTYVSWIEVRKPGQLTTLRLSQAIGRVLTK